MKANAVETVHVEQFTEQLQWACSRLNSAHKARDRLIAQAHKAGMSLRKIAAATGLSPTRVHQVLRAEAERESASAAQQQTPLAIDSLKKIFLFSALDEVSLTALSHRTVLRNFSKQTILINEGDNSDSLYLILSGSVQVYTSGSEGKEMLLCTLSTGDCFGELSLLDGQPRSASVRTLEPCQTLVLARADFDACLSQHPTVAQELLRALAAMVRQGNDRTKGLALMGVYERLVNTLMKLGEKRDGTIVVDNITHQSLAEQVYASREMITVILRDLRQGGYISADQHCITILKRLPSKW